MRAGEAVEGIGGGVTVAVATAAKLGTSAALIDALGGDAPAERIRKSLATAGVETSLVTEIPGATTSSASIWSSKATRERTIVYSPGTAGDSLTWTSEIAAAIAFADVVHTNGRHPAIWKRAIEVARQNKTQLSFDGGANRYRGETVPLLRASDIVIVAREFAESFFRDQSSAPLPTSLEALGEFLRGNLDAEIVGVTDGADGCLLSGPSGPAIRLGALNPERAIDTTGCGDTFHGGFLHGHVQGMSIGDCAQLATQVASRNARRMGAFAF